jgi:ketosteroid isomerase-like protein
VDNAFAEHFATDWIDAWNARDLERVLSHYADEFEMSSPFIAEIANEPSGTLRGKDAVAAYWEKALKLIPDLRFELIDVLVGVDSIVLYYKGARGRLAAEVFHFGAGRKILKAFAHYDV